LNASTPTEGAGRFTSFLLDIDGTVAEGETVLDGAPELLDYLRRDGRRFLFLTNNSRAWPAEVAASLTKLGLRCGEEEVLTAGHLAALRAAQRSKRGVYVLGSHSLGQMVIQAGGSLTENEPDVVLVGLDKDLSYERLSIACRAVGAGAAVVAANRDLSNPTELGLEPGAGVLLGAVRAYKPGHTLVCGKPSPVLAHEAQRRLGARRDEMLMIGDSPISDMRMAQRAGIAGALVETGVGAGESPGRVPGATFAFATLGDLLSWLRS
jgi:4-nitrophenyl phosphatase